MIVLCENPEYIYLKFRKGKLIKSSSYFKPFYEKYARPCGKCRICKELQRLDHAARQRVSWHKIFGKKK